MLFMMLSCSFQVPKIEKCSNTSECEETFGMGYSCGEEGYCDRFEPNERCQTTVPGDLYENWEQYKGAYIVGTLFKHSTDQANLVAATLALEEARELPLEGEHNFAMIHCDYEAQDEAGDDLTSSDAVRELSTFLGKEVGVSLVIGPADSEGSTIAFNATDDVLIISPSATSTTLSTIDGEIKNNDNPGRFWRTVASDALQARILATIVEDSAENIAFLYENSVYGSDFVSIMEESFSSGISSTRYPYNVGDASTAEAQRLLIGEQGYDAVVVVSSDIKDLTQIVEDSASDPMYSQQALFFADGAADSSFLDTAPLLQGTGIQVIGSRPPLLEGALFNTFEALFSLKAQELGLSDISASKDVYAAYTYDATWIGLYGYAWAHFQDDPFSYIGLGRGLRRLSDEEGTKIDINSSSWNTIQANFVDGSSVNIQGASGTLDYNPLTEELESTVEIWKLGSEYDCFALMYECTDTGCSDILLPDAECP